MPVQSVLIVLQVCQYSLWQRTNETEASKAQLRERFLAFGSKVALRLIALGHLAEVFDPKTGLPLISSPGSLRLDDVAIAHSALNYPIRTSGNCSILIHPTWGSAVYPSTLVSSAPLQIVEEIATAVESELETAIDGSKSVD